MAAAWRSNGQAEANNKKTERKKQQRKQQQPTEKKAAVICWSPSPYDEALRTSPYGRGHSATQDHAIKQTCDDLRHALRHDILKSTQEKKRWIWRAT
jgi:hypothetical protein